MILSSINKYQFRKLLFVCFGILLLNTSYSQQKLLEVRHINADDFPKVSADLWVRNPDGINSDAIEFFEETSTSPIKVNFTKKDLVKDSVAKNKCLVFLVLNPGSFGRNELEWYKNVIKRAIKSGAIKKGDKVEVLNFNNETGGQLIYPSTISFTDDLTVIERKINSISLRDARCLCSGINNRSLIYQSINQTLDLIEKQNLKIPAGIFVLADDRACLPGSTGETPGIRSRRLNIPIYGISYAKPDQLNAINTLCKESFGLYYSDLGRDATKSSDKLNSFINGFLQRQAGYYYSFNYESTYEKNGTSRTVKVDAKSANTAFLIPVPRKNIFEWIVANPILAALIFVLLVGIAFLIVYLVNNEKKKKELEKLLQQQQLSDLDRKHKESEQMMSAKFTSQQQELEAIKRKEQQQREAEQKKKIEAENEKRNAALKAQMSLKGNFPWFDYSIGNNIKNRFEISKPQIIVGRSENCDLSINVPTVSKSHFQLNYLSSGEYWVKDLGSSNGLYVNGEKVQQAQLRHGDFIQIGEIVLNFFI